MTAHISRTDRYFIVINRLVSLLLLLALLGMFAGAAVLGLLSLDGGPVKEPGMAKVEEKTVESSNAVILGFADAEQVHGADTDMVRLVVTNRERAYSAGRSGEARNVLFIGGAGQPARWLFKAHRNEVHVLEQLREGEEGRRDGRTAALYLEFTERRAGDDAGKAGNAVTVALAKPDGTGMKPVLRDVTRVLSHKAEAGRHINVLFLRGTALRQATVSLDDFTVTAEREVAKLPTSI
ncbi:hypothetical protein [Pseudoduganella lutea]|uniref:Uncharacterized protein n=1 Tax=Pseudoduganella lutea TaxID=321985 RepID=A0A4P6KSW9_9BURK|nr:hypothetical protein [Pseudoduganella lutea]QBE62219.1 hypothetical protein EWM63_03825 [Pseudoduganella lutea]